MEEKIIVPTLSREEVEDYRKRLGCYLQIMTYYKKMMDEGELDMEDYDRLELVYLKKYQINEKSLQRMDLKSIAERDDKFIYNFDK